MGKDMGFLVLLLLLMYLVVAASPLAQNNKFEEVSHQLDEEKLTQLHFYYHDTLSGKKPILIKDISGKKKPSSPAVLQVPQDAGFFGVLMMADDPLTEGPEPTSKLVGRAQGLYASATAAARQDHSHSLGFFAAMSFGFTEGVYNSSTLSILGGNHTTAMNSVHEIPIVRGTGIFQLARCTAVAKTYWFNTTTNDAIVEYHITAFRDEHV
ncbi:Plant disease resistance response protein [Macleaya cordata]|uniref:Dirigent protein n=1 Tax=Macleaya cordata TaxID=56857 RepID=A0A200QDN9_MACCD|nr:Plant disease resistance response protein [Macleaya cordata]